jgi:hypothetical protein
MKKEKSDAYTFGDYEYEMLKYMKQQEVKYMPRCDYMERVQSDINFTMYAHSQPRRKEDKSFFFLSFLSSFLSFLFFLSPALVALAFHSVCALLVSTPNRRAILVDWLVEVSEEYNLFPQTLYLTINYIDRLLQQVPIHRTKLQLVSVSCGSFSLPSAFFFNAVACVFRWELHRC